MVKRSRPRDRPADPSREQEAATFAATGGSTTALHKQEKQEDDKESVVGAQDPIPRSRYARLSKRQTTKENREEGGLEGDMGAAATD